MTAEPGLRRSLAQLLPAAAQPQTPHEDLCTPPPPLSRPPLPLKHANPKLACPPSPHPTRPNPLSIETAAAASLIALG